MGGQADGGAPGGVQAASPRAAVVGDERPRDARAAHDISQEEEDEEEEDEEEEEEEARRMH